jgi:hypothetical protein
MRSPRSQVPFCSDWPLSAKARFKPVHVVRETSFRPEVCAQFECSVEKTNLLGDVWRTKGEYDTLSCVVLRTCTVAVKDIRDVEHSIEVTAETLYEAIATALAALQQDNWVGEIGQGFATVTVLVQQPPVKHEVKMKDFVSWLGRQGRSPAEVVLKQKLERILGKINHGRT